MKLSIRQRRFFKDFGFLYLPGLMADDAAWIAAEFEAIFRQHSPVHDGNERSSVGSFFDYSERLFGLLEDHRIEGVLSGLLGDDFNYLGSGGELYVGDSMWHPDSHDKPLLQVKLALYLDHLTRATGALRLVPGSHLRGWKGNLDPQALWDIDPDEVPCVAPENHPGDVLVFHESTLHNSIGGGHRRRMLNLVCFSRARTDAELAFLDQIIAPRVGKLYSERLLQMATPKQMKHLDQIREREAHIQANL